MLAVHKAVVLMAGALGLYPSSAVTIRPEAYPTKVTVRQVVSMQALAGQTVEVRGRCLDRHAAAIAQGSRPQSGDVWQLEENGVATWVVGAQPKACASGEAVITARVAQDFLPRFSQARTVRQYLVAQ